MVKKSFKDILNGVAEKLKTVPEMLKALPEKLKFIPEKIKLLLDKIKRFFENLKEKFKEIGDANRAKKEAKKAERDPSEKRIDWMQVWLVCREVFRWIFRLRSILLALPVMVASVILAAYSSSRLPEYVGINMQASGEYAMMISRNVAVMGPLALTAMCLLLMFCSKKVLYPWLISIFSLALPLLFLFTSTFP